MPKITKLCLNLLKLCPEILWLHFFRTRCTISRRNCKLLGLKGDLSGVGTLGSESQFPSSKALRFGRNSPRVAILFQFTLESSYSIIVNNPFDPVCSVNQLPELRKIYFLRSRQFFCFTSFQERPRVL